jgi:diguanylate cyclase (GGDEF)-like protein
MAKDLACPACGALNVVPRCRDCGAELLTDAVPLSHDAAASDRDERASDRDQTLSDHDQTLSDQDQTWSDRDQAGSESDQRSADEDQHAADDDFAASGDAAVYHRSASAQARSSRDRHAVSALRRESASERLESGGDRDRAAALRDRGAEGRDALARPHDLELDENASREDILARAARDRARAAADRAKAAEDRARAAADREEAARERADARRHRAEVTNDLKLAATDELTGAWTRKLGLREISREIERAHRTGATLVLAFIDVDGLKQVNDTLGHLAGDSLLRLLGETLSANVRPYDVIVRYGGDELVCAMPNLGMPEARARFEAITAAMAAVDAEHSVTVGLASAEPADGLHELIGRADRDLLARRAAKGT